MVLETEAFLNLGYSPRYLPHIIGSSQRRLVTHLGEKLAPFLSSTTDPRVLDVGCGRGGPTVQFADRFGVPVAGIDLVPYNVARARENASALAGEVSFVLGDATTLPFDQGSFAACTAIDSIVYLPDRPAAFREIADVLRPGGMLVLSDLLTKSSQTAEQRDRVASFATAWDMPVPDTVSTYRERLAETGFSVVEQDDITANSVGRFRRWTTPFHFLMASPAGSFVESLLDRYGLDPEPIADMVNRAHRALPHLRHVVIVAENRDA